MQMSIIEERSLSICKDKTPKRIYTKASCKEAGYRVAREVLIITGIRYKSLGYITKTKGNILLLEVPSSLIDYRGLKSCYHGRFISYYYYASSIGLLLLCIVNRSISTMLRQLINF